MALPLKEKQSQKNLGLSKPRIVWDMTFAARSLTGTRVHTQNLFQHLCTRGDWDMQQICDPRNGGKSKLKANAQSIAWLWSGLEKELRRAQPALFHAAAYLGPRRAPCPMIVNVFDTTYLTYPRDFDWKWRFYARTVIPHTVKRAAAVITDSEMMRANIVRVYQVPPERVHVIPPGIDAEFHPITNEHTIAAMRTRYGLGQDYLLYVGERHPRKNLPALLAAFARVRRKFPTLEFAIAGPRRTTDEFTRALNEFNVRDAVRELDFVPSSDLPALYAGARAFVFASKLEGFGMPPVEAMACGTPVIAAPNPPLPQVLGDAAQFARDDSPEALAAEISRVLDDDTLANALRARGVARAREFTWERAAQATALLYDSVLHK